MDSSKQTFGFLLILNFLAIFLTNPVMVARRRATLTRIPFTKNSWMINSPYWELRILSYWTSDTVQQITENTTSHRILMKLSTLSLNGIALSMYPKYITFTTPYRPTWNSNLVILNTSTRARQRRLYMKMKWKLRLNQVESFKSAVKLFRDWNSFLLGGVRILISPMARKRRMKHMEIEVTIRLRMLPLSDPL